MLADGRGVPASATPFSYVRAGRRSSASGYVTARGRATVSAKVTGKGIKMTSKVTEVLIVGQTGAEHVAPASTVGHVADRLLRYHFSRAGGGAGWPERLTRVIRPIMIRARVPRALATDGEGKWHTITPSTSERSR